VNGPGEALISDLGVAGANRKSGFYLNGQRQKLRLDNNNIAEQLEQQVRQYLAAREQLIGIKQLD
jgi:(E)-4-hydroxy-3-methylbut-2-enyl-diphosphate synthase